MMKNLNCGHKLPSLWNNAMNEEMDVLMKNHALDLEVVHLEKMLLDVGGSRERKSKLTDP